MGWRPRQAPLAPVAVVCEGEAASRMGRRLLRDPRLAAFEAVAAEQLLVLIGDDLPWVDGCHYLGRDARCPRLYLPTTLEPDVPPPLLERAALRLAGAAPPLAVLVQAGLPPRLVGLGGARLLARAPLEAWLESQA